MRNENIIVTGIGIATPILINLDKKSNFQKNQEVDVNKIPHGLTLRQLKKLDKFSVISISAIKQALEEGKACNKLDKTGLIIGNVYGGWNYVEEQLYELYQGDFSAINAYVATAWFPAAPQGEASILLGSKGYSKTISAGDLSSAYAIEHGMQLIQDKTLEVVCCGGVEAPVTPLLENVIKTDERYITSDTGLFFCLQDKRDMSDKEQYKFTIESIDFFRNIAEFFEKNIQLFNDVKCIVHSENIMQEDLKSINEINKINQYIAEDYIGYVYGAAFAMDVYLAYLASMKYKGKTLVIRKDQDGQYVMAVITIES